MRSTSLFRTLAVLSAAALWACSAPSPTQPRAGVLGMNDFLLAFNTYSTAQTHLKQGRHPEAVVEYEESLTRYTRLAPATRERLRTEFGLSRQQIERELFIARSLADRPGSGRGDVAFRARVLDGFYPYRRGTPLTGTITPGLRISADNWQAAQGLLPSQLLRRVSDGDFSIVVQETTDLPPSAAYIVATLGAGDQVRLGDDGAELAAYRAGLPFAALSETDPQAGLKVAWNIRYRDSADRIEQWTETVSRDSQGQTQYTFSSHSAQAFGMYRARQEYNVADWRSSGIVAKEYVQLLSFPFDQTSAPAGHAMGFLRHRYQTDRRPIGQWMTAPNSGQFRTVGHNPEASALGFTMIAEDVVGEQIPTFDWRLVARQLALAPGFVRGRTARFGGSGGGYPTDPWELRQVYVLETLPRSPKHPYSRRVLYVDQQTAAPLYALMFDAEGRHWRTLLYSYGHPRYAQDNLNVEAPILLGRSWIDHQTERTTVSNVNRSRYNHDLSLELFSFSRLMQRGK